MEPNLAGSIYVRSKPGIDGPWVCPFQNCVRQHSLAANTNFIALGVNKPGLETKIYKTWGEHATSNYYATDVAIKQNHNIWMEIFSFGVNQ
jgi:hypothetical protein